MTCAVQEWEWGSDPETPCIDSVFIPESPRKGEKRVNGETQDLGRRSIQSTMQWELQSAYSKGAATPIGLYTFWTRNGNGVSPKVVAEEMELAS